MKNALIYVILVGLFFQTNNAHTDIVKWVDEEGKTHYGDKVPEEYKKSSESIDVNNVNVVKNDAPAPARRTSAVSRIHPNEELSNFRRHNSSKNNIWKKQVTKRMTKDCENVPSLAIKIKCNKKRTQRGY